ncbi:hypothetical protein PYCCODRAFT_1401603 [Trametes coccinea BRFM310]|uniref:AB hydrolase-1 domain-containing protein n=1 Tax=Trametes coccinea (strain BRFM310) TaxID=1353009 RepID=A0A1Y2J5D4_TRAC3|nr:hypothetical protein PYCCODRAFT_1401603 [Trametes coccinea BRFM310]
MRCFTQVLCILYALVFATIPQVFALADIRQSSLNVGNGVQLAYLDSGVPPRHASPYTTVFALHGEVYYSPIFQKIIDLAPSANVRFVAITRRDYNGSTPYDASEIQVLSNGTSSEKAAFLQARGSEIVNFIDTFNKIHDLPPISSDGQEGGIALLGWSFGNAFTLATLSNIHTYAAPLKNLLVSRLRALILHEPVPFALGTPIAPGSWWPQIDDSISVDIQGPATVQWLTSYFQHGNISTRDPSVLSLILPSIARPPSIFNMTQSQVDGMTNIAPSLGSDEFLIVNGAPQLLDSYRSALFNASIRNALPRMKASLIAGDMSLQFGITGLWNVQEDDEAAGGGFVNFTVVHGFNHFALWDEPGKIMALYAGSL